jgi:hypothetical protein
MYADFGPLVIPDMVWPGPVKESIEFKATQKTWGNALTSLEEPKSIAYFTQCGIAMEAW